MCSLQNLIAVETFDSEKKDKSKKKQDEEPVQQEGADTDDMYRAADERISKLSAEDAVNEWRKYLLDYPKSPFRPVIEKKIDELEAKLYDGKIEQEGVSNKGDRGRNEIRFAQPMTLENIDPRNKLRFAFELGQPNYFNFLVNYEKQLWREMSVHGGLRKRYSGWNAEGGVHYALVKSSRLQTLVTLLGDVHINTEPFFPALRPQIAAGKRFSLPSDMKLDMMAQVGTDLQIINGLTPVLIGGGMISFIPNKIVNIFVETSTYMKEFGWEEGEAFSFNTVAFGIKFFDRTKKQKWEAGLGSSVPYHQRYWNYHYGSVIADYHYYMK